MKHAIARSLLKCKKLLIALCICSSALMTTGCASSTGKFDAKPIPANLASSCPDLEPLAGTTGKEVVPWAVLTVRQYQDCQDKVKGLQEAWPTAPP